MWTLLAIALGAAPVPTEVQRCVDAGIMWLGDPQSFEVLEVQRAGSLERAVQIVDRHRGHTGYLLLFPRDCRLTVLALSPPKGRLQRTATLIPANGNVPTESETAQLLARAGHAEASDAPEQAAADAHDRHEGWFWVDTWGADDVEVTHRERPLDLAWHDGAPPPQQAVWTETSGRGMRTWDVAGWNAFAWGAAWDGPRSELDAVVFPALDRSNLLGVSVYDPHADQFAWIASLVVDQVKATAVRQAHDHLWALGPARSETGWTLYAVDLRKGQLHGLEFVPTETVVGWQDARLTEEGLLIVGTQELWGWDSLTGLLEP